MYKIHYDGESYGNMLSILEKSCYFSELTIIRSRKVPSGYFMNKKCMGYIDTKGGFSPNELLIRLKGL